MSAEPTDEGSSAAAPHPALRATFSREREKGFTRTGLRRRQKLSPKQKPARIAPRGLCLWI